MKPDGGRRRTLVPAEFGVQSPVPTWAPDGTRIAFVRNTASPSSRFVRGGRGCSPRRRVGDEPRLGAEGRSIAFVRTPANSDRGRLAVMRPDGSGLRNLVPHLQDVGDLACPRTAAGLFFTRRISPDSELFRLRLSDGVVHKVTRNSISEYDAAWGPPR